VFSSVIRHVKKDSSAVVPGVLMVTPQAIMFEPTAAAAPTSVGPASAAASSCDDAVAAGADAAESAPADRRPDVDDLQQHRMIVPLDIVTSITISHSLLPEPTDARWVHDL
jgi:hypothetical protein